MRKVIIAIIALLFFGSMAFAGPPNPFGNDKPEPGPQPNQIYG
jgi:hypothetical protein